MSTLASGIERIDGVGTSASFSSRRLVAAAGAERERLERELRRATQQASAAAEELQRAVEIGHELRQRIALLDELTGDERPRDEADEELRPPPVAASPPPHGTLRGAQIRVVGVRLLATSGRSRTPIHYTEWFDLVRDAGFGVAGRDPVATFLTQVTRSPVVVRAADPGTYAIDFDALRRLRDELQELHVELARIHEGQQTIEGVVSVRERRIALTTEITRVERTLHEAAEALGPEAPL